MVAPGSLVSAAAFLSSTRARATVRAADACTLAAFGPAEMEALLARRCPTLSWCLDWSIIRVCHRYSAQRVLHVDTWRPTWRRPC